MSYDAASFKAGFALGRMLWRPCSVRPLSSPPLLPIVDLSDRSTTHVADLLPYPPSAAYWLSSESVDAALADAKKRFGGST